MKIEIPIDQYSTRIGNLIDAHGIANILNKECRRIVDKHKQSCQNEIEQLVAGFTVRAAEQFGAPSVIIHLPDPPQGSPKQSDPMAGIQNDSYGNPVGGG